MRGRLGQALSSSESLPVVIEAHSAPVGWARVPLTSSGDLFRYFPEPLKRAEECTEIGQLIFEKNSPTKHRHGVMCPSSALSCDSQRRKPTTSQARLLSARAEFPGALRSSQAGMIITLRSALLCLDRASPLASICSI